MLLLAIACGGALGAMARYGVDLTGDVGAGGFPWPTFAVNVTGSFVLGLVVTFLEARVRPTPRVRAFVAIGFLGAYTTFSTWTVETVLLVRQHAGWMAALYAILTPVAGLAAVFLGALAGRAWPTGGGQTHEAGRKG